MDNENFLTFLERRPDNLCKRCGKCCRVSTTKKNYEEIRKLAENNDKEAMDFLEIFEPYENIEEAKKAGKETVENINDYENRTFYRCKFIGNDNLCTRYEARKEVCKRFPSSPFAVVPPECGYKEWLEQEKMKIVDKVLELKKDRNNYLSELNEDISDYRRELLKNLVISIEQYIKIYEDYGSKDW